MPQKWSIIQLRHYQQSKNSPRKAEDLPRPLTQPDMAEVDVARLKQLRMDSVTDVQYIIQGYPGVTSSTWLAGLWKMVEF